MGASLPDRKRLPSVPIANVPALSWRYVRNSACIEDSALVYDRNLGLLNLG
jgi:hypothetical protein